MDRLKETNRDKYKVIFEGSKVGVWEWPDLTKEELYWSPRMSEILGINHETYVPQLSWYFSLVFPEDRTSLQEHIDRHLQYDEEFSIDYRIVLPSGDVKWVQGSGQTLRDEEGNATSMYGIIQDIHKRKLAEKQTTENLAFLTTAEDLAKIGSFKWDPESNNLWFSAGAKKLFDFAPDEEVSFELFINKIVPEDRKTLLDEIAEKSAQKLNIDLKYRIYTQTEKFIESVSTYFKDEFNGTSYYMGIVQDRTETKKKDVQVQELISNLQRSNADLEQYAYVASHDLQEPLRKIQIFGERLLERSDSLPEKEQLYVQRMENASQRMQKLISDLLDFSRASRVKDVSEKIDLNEVLKTIQTDLEAKIEDLNATLDIKNLPKVTGNSGQLYRLFLNLISNGLKFQKEDTAAHISISADTVTRSFLESAGIHDAIYLKYHRIQVKDNGIGFEKEYTNKIFTLFQRLHGKSEYEGTGIGLAICRKIVSNHGGYILAESEVGKGSAFFVFLPKHHNKAV